MSRSVDSPTAASSAPASSADETRLHGRLLVMVRGAWMLVVACTLAIFGASLPVYIAQLQTPCAGPACFYTLLSPEQVEALKALGLSPGDYIAYTVALTLVLVVVCVVVSLVLVWRRPDDRMALLVALMLVPFGPILVTNSVSGSASLWQVPNVCLYFLALSLLVLVFLLFPGGQFVPRWMRWTPVVLLAGLVPSTFMPNSLAAQLGWPVSLGEGVLVVAVQLYRYRRVSSLLQRHQTKWVVFGLTVPLLVFVGGGVLQFMVPGLADPHSLYPVAYNAVSACLSLSIPLSFGFALLRYRLWDIDLLINKALVYGLLTGLLGALYAGLIIGLESLAGLLGETAAQNPVVLVVSTLAIALLFLPARRRIQALIDRRFYRKNYEAGKVLAAFAARLREAPDLEQICEQLIAGVQETMQPTQVSLWLRQPGRHPIDQAHRLDPPGPGSAQPGESSRERRNKQGGR